MFTRNNTIDSIKVLNKNFTLLEENSIEKSLKLILSPRFW